jgi:hypothetical protein
MFRELDRVALKKALPKQGLNRGAVGSIVRVHSKNAGYEVEFVAPYGKLTTVVRLKSSDFRVAD